MTENRIAVTRAWGKGKNGELFCNEYRASVWDDEKALDMRGGDGHTTVWIYLLPLNCTLKNS